MSQGIASTVAPTQSKWKPYPAYKDSGIEWLEQSPKHWETKRLKYACQVNPTKSEISALPKETEVSFLPMEQIGEDGTLALDTTKTIEQAWQSYTYFRNQDVILAKITPCFENGKGAICDGLINGIGFGTTELHVLRAQNENNSGFIFYLTQSHPFRSPGVAMMYGAAGQQRVPEEFIKDYYLGLPSPEEQEAIINFLDRETAKIDALIAKKERLIELLEEKRTALISHAVTKGLDPNAPMKDSGIEWLGQVPKHWEILPSKRLGDFQGGTGFPDEEQGLSNEELPFYKVSDTNLDGNETWMTRHNNSISKKIAEKLRAFIFPAETIVFAKVGAALLLNKRRILARSACIDNNIMGFTRRNCDLKWVYYWMYGLDLGRLANPGAVPSVNEEQLRNVPIPVPETEEQRAIAVFLDRETAKIDGLVAKIHQHIEKLREYRTAIISAAVTGKIDIRNS